MGTPADASARLVSLALVLLSPYNRGMYMNRISGFTLIELLVVIAIIGILSAIVLADLSAARKRGAEAGTRSTLKSLVAEVELNRDANPDYNFVNSCANAGTPLAKFITGLSSSGVIAAGCYSGSLNGGADSYTRWGAAAVESATPLVAYSASSSGVGKWDAVDTNPGIGVSWSSAQTLCRNQGKRLPTAEEFRSLWKVTQVGNAAPGFLTSSYYWSSTEVPGVGANAYRVGMIGGSVNSALKTDLGAVRCVI